MDFLHEGIQTTNTGVSFLRLTVELYMFACCQDIKDDFHVCEHEVYKSCCETDCVANQIGM